MKTKLLLAIAFIFCLGTTSAHAATEVEVENTKYKVYDDSVSYLISDYRVATYDYLTQQAIFANNDGGIVIIKFSDLGDPKASMYILNRVCARLGFENSFKKTYCPQE